MRAPVAMAGEPHAAQVPAECEMPQRRIVGVVHVHLRTAFGADNLILMAFKTAVYEIHRPSIGGFCSGGQCVRKSFQS